MSTIEAPRQAFQEFEAARSQDLVHDLLRQLVKARLVCFEKGLNLHEAIAAFEAKVLEGISIGELNAREFEAHYVSVQESWDRWIEGIQSESDQAFEIPEVAKSDVALRVSRLLDEAISRKENIVRRQSSMDASIVRAPLPAEWSEPGLALTVPSQNATDLRDYIASLPR